MAKDDTQKVSKLLLKIREGDQQVFEELLNIKTPPLLKLAYKYLRDIMLSEDVVNQTFFELSFKCAYIKNEENLNGWLNTIVINKCLDIIAKRKREMFIDVSEEAHIFDQNVKAPDIVEKIHVSDCLLRLDKDERVALLYKHNGYTLDEIVNEMRITKAKVRWLIKKAKDKFMKYYSN